MAEQFKNQNVKEPGVMVSEYGRTWKQAQRRIWNSFQNIINDPNTDTDRNDIIKKTRFGGNEYVAKVERRITPMDQDEIWQCEEVIRYFDTHIWLRYLEETHGLPKFQISVANHKQLNHQYFEGQNNV